MPSSVTLTESALLLVDVQVELGDEGEEPPSSAQLQYWAAQAYVFHSSAPAELTVRLVGVEEMVNLNQQYRDKSGPTNVLSFALNDDLSPDGFVLPASEELESPLLGDVVICHPVVAAEALEQCKTLHDHYAHLVAHGVLHLCGYDHQTEAQAKVMESLEQELLAAQGIANPYS